MDASPAEFRFGSARLDVEQRQLLIDDRPAKLGARAFDVLLALIERRERAGQQERAARPRLAGPGGRGEQPAGADLGAAQAARRRRRSRRFPGAATASPPHRSNRRRRAPAPRRRAEPRGPIARRWRRPHADEPAGALEPLYGRDDDVARASASCCGRTRWSRSSAPAASARRGWRRPSPSAQRERFPDGVWWVELAALSDGALVAGSDRAGARRARVDGGRAGARRRRRAAAEPSRAAGARQLRAPARRGSPSVFASCCAARPALRVLVTSQEALHTRRGAGLSARRPADRHARRAPAAAVELFVARARAADPRLQLGRRRAAGRCGDLPPARRHAAGHRAGRRARAAARRRRAARAARRALPRADRRHARGAAPPPDAARRARLEPRAADRRRADGVPRLGVFVGGFTLELAQDVAADAQDRPLGGARPAGHLVDKSLVLADGDDVPRYRLLETAARCALEKLAAAGETPALLRRHAEALLAFLRAARRCSDGRRDRRPDSSRRGTGQPAGRARLGRIGSGRPRPCLRVAGQQRRHLAGACTAQRGNPACDAPVAAARTAWHPRSRHASTCCWARSAIAARGASAFLLHCARRSCIARWATRCA